MSLPIMTDPEDVQAIVNYLRKKPVGAQISEAKAVLNQKLLDGRRLSAYKTWGFIEQSGTKILLTDRGRDFSLATSEKKTEIFAEIAREQRPYLLAIEHMFYKDLAEALSSDIGALWAQQCAEVVGSDNETSINNQVTCFLSIAQAAGLGTRIIGRKGQPTRFAVERNAIGQFIGETELTHTDDDDTFRDESVAVNMPPQPEIDSEIISSDNIQETARDSALPSQGSAPERVEVRPIRVFISHSKNMDIVEQIKTMLDVAKLNYEIAVEEETTAIPVPEKVLTAMRECSAAIICVTADGMSQETQAFSINENVLIEIGSAFVLYDKRVVLVWDKRLQVPSNLQGLYRCEFEGNELSWHSGMKLLKAIQKFSD